VTEDVAALSDDALLERYYGALQAMPRITEGDLEARRRAWVEVRRYHDELARRSRLNDHDVMERTSREEL